MARKKMRKFAEGGTSDEIVVRGAPKVAQVDLNTLDRLMHSSNGIGLGGGMTGMGGGAGSDQRMGPGIPVAPRSRVSVGKTYTAAGPVYGPRYSSDNFSIGAGLGRGALGKVGAPVAGVSGSLRFKDGGKAKTKKMAKGGSTASKRADGCATKGKTKGRFV